MKALLSVALCTTLSEDLLIVASLGSVGLLAALT